jgi:hypothetical protein
VPKHDTSRECVHGGDGGYASLEVFGEEPAAPDSVVEELIARIPGEAACVAIALAKSSSTVRRSWPTRRRPKTIGCNMMDATALEGVQAFIDKRQQALGVSH